MTDHRVMLVSGDMLDPFDPDPDMLTIEVIAHHLSMQCRFNGACREFYSVASHSRGGATTAEYSYNGDFDLARAFLLHDAHEFVIGDIITPLKPLLVDSPWWHAADALDLAIQKRFDVSFDDPRIKRIDDHVLAIEWRRLMPDEGKYDHLRVPYFSDMIFIEPPQQSRDLFIAQAKRLGLS